MADTATSATGGGATSTPKKTATSAAKDAGSNATPKKTKQATDKVEDQAQDDGQDQDQDQEQDQDQDQDQADDDNDNVNNDEGGQVDGEELTDGVEPEQQAGDAADEAGDAAEDAGEQAEDTGEQAEDAGEQAEDAPADAEEKAGEAADEAPEGEEPAEDTKDAADDNVKKTAEQGEDAAEDAADQNQDKNQDQDGDGEGDEVVPAGKVDDEGKVVDDDGNVIGKISDGKPEELKGSIVDQEGDVVDDEGNVIGKAEPEGGDTVEDAKDKAQDTKDEADDAAPTIDPESIEGPLTVKDNGEVTDKNGKTIGKVVDGDIKSLVKNKKIKGVDKDGNLLGEDDRPVGKIELASADGDADDEPEKPDLSVLEGKKVNKAGNVVDEAGTPWGRLIKGDAKKLAGRACDAEGKIWNDSGKVVGEAELIPEDERKDNTIQPFEDYPDNTIDKEGNVKFEGQIVGKVIEGDPKKLVGKKVDPDGDIVDRNGNVLGKAERYDESEPEPEEEVEVDRSELAGKKVNKAGNIVDDRGALFGKLIEGDPKKLAGHRCDKHGNVWNDSGEIVGKAELLPPSERDAAKEGPFADFPGSTVDKSGKVVDAKGNVVGRLIQGDAKTLAGKSVDDEGDVLDKNGNPLGKAERWEEEEKEKAHNPLVGRKVNREGNVVDENGDVIGKLTEGTLAKCVGKEIDEDGDIIDQKGQTIGHATLLDDLPPEPEPEPEEKEPEKSPEEIEKERKEKEDKELAKKLSTVIGQSIERIKPVLNNISERLEQAERTPKNELDEEKLVNDVKPLIEEGGRILSETNGTIRGLDPDGRIQANAKHKAAVHEASGEEYSLAEKLKELTENVQTTIDKAKRRIAGMPHAKKKLNPLWGLLTEPLGQIIAAVGLLLSGVLGLVGKLLGGLGLGGLVNNLLGGLGLDKVLDGLGLDGVLGGGKK